LCEDKVARHKWAASTFDQEGGTKVLLKYRLHHRAAAYVTKTDTENLFHHQKKNLLTRAVKFRDGSLFRIGPRPEPPSGLSEVHAGFSAHRNVRYGWRAQSGCRGANL